jgi:3-hydroxymyristoyl/3-hydroxydecanoyl-(acyl carrier protein) dehydratase
VSDRNVLTHSSAFTVPADHPAIPGHFPGDPLVPGVVILERVIDAAESWLGRPLQVAGVPQAKFVAPLRPGERADLSIALDGQALSFTLRREGVLLGRGALRLQSAGSP